MSVAELRPTPEEIQRRVAAVAELAREQGLDAVVALDPDNVYYLSGFRTTLHTRFTAVALRTDDPGSVMLIAPSVDKRLAEESIWFPSLLERTEIYYEGVPEGGPLTPSPGPPLDSLIRDGDTLGVALAGADYGQVTMLTSRYPNARLVDVSEILHTARRVKSTFELTALRRANAVAVAALVRVPSLLHVGMTEIDLGLAIDALARRDGADGAGYPTLVGFGPKSLAPHAPPTARRLEPNQIVTIAFGPTVAGYTADIVRTFFFGNPPEAAIEAGAKTVEIQAAALDAVRAGAKVSELTQAAGSAIVRLFPGASMARGVGHSVGLSVHETPRLTFDVTLQLQPDMVLAVEPSSPISAMEGIGLYRHCDVVRVRDDGYELLTPLERGLIHVSIREENA